MSERRGRHLLDGLELLPMRSEHASDVARLHYKELSWSFNGQLGPEHVRELYEALVCSKFFFGYVIYRNGELLGFVTATTDSGQMRSSIRRAYRGKLLRVAALMLRHPSFLMGVLESLFVVPIAFKRYATKAEWLTFVTNTEVSYLTPLVAIKLIDAVRDHFHACGISIYLAQGVKQNPKAMRLYEKLGWDVAARLVIHNIYVYRSSAHDAAMVLDKR
jgi:UPF0716 family protein affecting phage T7 exclusion